MSNKNRLLQGRDREIVRNIDKYFLSEKHKAHKLLDSLNIARFQSGYGSNIPITSELFNLLTDYLKAHTKTTERVALSTGVNKNTVCRIRREGREADASGTALATPVKRPRGKKVVLDEARLHALSNLINEFYVVEEEVPTLNKIYNKAKDKLNFKGSKSTLRRIMSSELGYEFKRSPSKTDTSGPAEDQSQDDEGSEGSGGWKRRITLE